MALYEVSVPMLDYDDSSYEGSALFLIEADSEKEAKIAAYMAMGKHLSKTDMPYYRRNDMYGVTVNQKRSDYDTVSDWMNEYDPRDTDFDCIVSNEGIIYDQYDYAWKEDQPDLDVDPRVSECNDDRRQDWMNSI